MRDLKEKVIVIPGASGGVGQAICKLLSRRGCKLCIGSNEPEKLKNLERELKQEGTEVVSMEMDVTVEEEVNEFLELAEESFGRLDVLLNLPGLSQVAEIAEMSEEDYDKIMDVNVKGSFFCCKHFIPKVNAEEGAQIINIGSMAAKRANANAPMYCTAKAAVNMFSDGLALQAEKKDIRVTTLNPGPIDSPFWGDRNVPRDKFLTPMDVAEVIEFVLTRDSHVLFHEINFESITFLKEKH